MYGELPEIAGRHHQPIVALQRLATLATLFASLDAAIAGS